MGVVTFSTWNQQEYLILSALADAREPVGSGAVSETLRAAGLPVSEATAGRLLRSLDLKGYTSRDGFRGRSLTPLGLGRLQELRRERQRRSTSTELMNLLRASHRDDLIDILVARRAIERETARLAALNARTEDLRELSEVVGLTPGTDGEEDVRFHKLIARASGNRILEAAVDLIRQDAQLSPVLVYIRQQVQSTLVAEHRRILKAIQSRDPAAAEAAMVDHLENLIRDVRKYWGRAEASPEATGS